MLSFNIHAEMDDDTNITLSYCLDKQEAVYLPDGRDLTRGDVVRMMELGFADRLKLFISKGNWGE